MVGSCSIPHPWCLDTFYGEGVSQVGAWAPGSPHIPSVSVWGTAAVGLLLHWSCGAAQQPERWYLEQGLWLIGNHVAQRPGALREERLARRGAARGCWVPGAAACSTAGSAARSHTARPWSCGAPWGSMGCGELWAGGWWAHPPQSTEADGPSEASCPFRIDSPRWMVNDCFPGLIKLSSSGLLHRGGGAFPTCAAASDCGPGRDEAMAAAGICFQAGARLGINPAAWQLCGEDLGGGSSLWAMCSAVLSRSALSPALSGWLRPWMLEERLAGAFPTSVVLFLRPAWSLLPLPWSFRFRLQTRLYFQLFLKPSNIWQLDSHCRVACFAERVTSRAIVRSF